MTTQARASRRRQWLEVVAGSIAIILVAVILVAVFQPPDDTPELLPGTVASPAANRASASSTGVGGTATNASRLPLSATSAGFVVTLSRAEIMTGRASGAPMTLTFHVEDIDPISPPSTRQYAPPLPADFELEGLVWAGEFTGSVRPTSDRENPVIELELEFRLEGDPSTPVEVRITTLRFTPKAGDNEPTAIEGTWTFTFVPRDIAIDDVE